MQAFLSPDKLFFMTPWQRKNVNVFLLLDCADKAGIVAKAIHTWPHLEAVSLYMGTKDEDDADIGPHLVKVTRDSRLMQWFLKEGADAGIIVFSEGDTELLADHLRPYLECILPDDRSKMFRFYAPEAFYYFVPSLTPEELRLFMGPACGAACPRPICAEAGDSLFVEHPVTLEVYAPPKKRLPWFISEASYAGFIVPAEYSLALALTRFFFEEERSTAKRVGQEHVMRFARKIVEQNRVFGLKNQRKIMSYFHLVSKIGISYQHDPQFRRISEAMQAAQTPEDSLQALSTEVNEFRVKVRGDGDEWYHAALQRVMRISYADWYKPNFETEAAAMLTTLYPERAAYAGEQAILELVGMARQEAERWALPQRPGICMLSGLMFFLGVGCVADPLYPWVSKKLHEKISPDRKTRDLFDLGKRLAKIVLRGKIA